MRSKICRNLSSHAVCDAPIARITGCVLIKDIGRRLPLELQCNLYQGQQGDVDQSVRGNYKNPFLRDQNLTAVEGNASVHQVYPVSSTTSKERAECLKGWGGGGYFKQL